jgi:GntR family transcriptional repressor for pyruvate dehydrogenase complex
MQHSNALMARAIAKRPICRNNALRDSKTSTFLIQPANPMTMTSDVKLEPTSRRPRRLADDVEAHFRQRIDLASLSAGDKLPTETELMRSFGVSRTVIREALSRMQAAGLVETHQGIGTFVMSPKTQGMMRATGSESLAPLDVVAVLELRVGLETEAAGLAAVRRTDENLRRMREALDEFEAQVQSPGGTVTPDFRFHMEIARATGNSHFVDVLTPLGSAIIPRTRTTATTGMTAQHSAQYLHFVNQEHEQIFNAIARQDADCARAAMKLHLGNSRARMKRSPADVDDVTVSNPKNL